LRNTADRPWKPPESEARSTHILPAEGIHPAITIDSSSLGNALTFARGLKTAARRVWLSLKNIRF
ncbi:MAG: hypothetical protein ACLPGW_04050, partial [Roseiarcus sp.]